MAVFCPDENKNADQERRTAGAHYYLNSTSWKESFLFCDSARKFAKKQVSVLHRPSQLLQCEETTVECWLLPGMRTQGSDLQWVPCRNPCGGKKKD